MLHTVNKSPFSNQCLAECLRICDADDAILLIEDGVYAALKDSEWIVAMLAKTTSIYLLQPDAAARGLIDHIAPAIALVDYPGFVKLCTEQPKMMSWY